MKVYIDSEYRCHTTNPDGTFREVDEAFFDDKCQTFIEGYCYDDSKGYAQVYPWRPYPELDSAQRVYEKQLLSEYEKALAEIEVALGVSV